jgi:hypothetical protein
MFIYLTFVTFGRLTVIEKEIGSVVQNTKAE